MLFSGYLGIVCDIFQPGGQLETPGLVQTEMFEKSWKPGVNTYMYI